jgi:hypothetical protein
MVHYFVLTRTFRLNLLFLLLRCHFHTGKIDAIDGPSPLFIDRKDLTQKVGEKPFARKIVLDLTYFRRLLFLYSDMQVLREMQPIVEAWSGIELRPSIAYGFRLYR